MDTEFLNIQIDTTRALIKFIEDHDGAVDSDLNKCLYALEKKDIEAAVNHAKLIKPHGMGGLTDWYPPKTIEGETREYNEQVLRALVNEWCRVISLSFEKQDSVSTLLQKRALSAPVKPNGIVFCVFCGKTFSSKDSVSWDGQRHKTCGNKLKLFPAESFDEFRSA
jgi:hypothetical protein